MTEKLYYQDSYLSEFEAKVLSCAQKGNKYEVVLSGTAFFLRAEDRQQTRESFQRERRPCRF